MNPNKTQPRITITESTRLSDLEKFTENLNYNAKLRGKINKDGTYSLKVSTKGNGTGLKDALFSTVKIRRDSARLAMARVAFREGNADLAKELRKKSGELTAGDLKALLSTSTPSNSVKLDLTHEPSLNDDFNALEFELTKSTAENKSTMHCTNFFKKTKDDIYRICKKDDADIAKELKRDELIEEENLALMGKRDRKILAKFSLAEKAAASREEAALENTERNNLVKSWKNIQYGINLSPTGRAERNEFNKLCFDFSRNIDGHEFFPTNVGLTVLGLGVAIDRSINLVLTDLEEIIITLNENNSIGNSDAIKTKIINLTREVNLDEKIKQLKFAATLLMNDEFLSALPKDKRVPLGILGVNMANLARTFEKPDGQYQSLRRVFDEAAKNPEKFIERARKLKKPGEPGQLSEPTLENNADASASQEQIEF